MKNCQHYRYNSDSYDLIEGDSKYFADHFSPDENKVNWLNFHTVSDRASIDVICQRYSIDSKTVRKLTLRKEWGIEEYENFTVVKLPTVDGNDITFIITSSFIFTLQSKKYEIFSLVRERIAKRIGKIRVEGNDFLLFRLLHCMINHYSQSMDELESKVSSVESSDGKDLLLRVEDLKKELYEMKKKVSPVKSAVAELEKMNNFVESENIRHFNELKHHAADLIDSVDECRNILDGYVNIYYAKQGQRMNEVMKLLTLISTIFIPLTFLAGLYGMNFKYMPELEAKWAYPTLLVTMCIIAIFLRRWFKKKGWFE
jgi:magnesium transporter